MAYVGLQERYDHLRCLLHLANADGQFTLAELTYVVWVAKQLQVSSSELERLSKEPLPKVFFQSEAEKLKQFHQLLNLLKVDGLADVSELKELKKIGSLMGFSEERLSKLIDRISIDPSQLLMEEELAKILK